MTYFSNSTPNIISAEHLESINNRFLSPNNIPNITQPTDIVISFYHNVISPYWIYIIFLCVLIIIIIAGICLFKKVKELPDVKKDDAIDIKDQDIDIDLKIENVELDDDLDTKTTSTTNSTMLSNKISEIYKS